MKRIEIETKNQPHFIGIWNILNDELCKEIINFFENNPEIQKEGATASGTDENIKKSTDITIDPNDLKKKNYDLFNNYFKHLNSCFLDYKNQFPFLKTFANKINIGSFNIQKYKPGDHFAKVHSERTHITCLHRLFAWMTYLNDVNVLDGGTTDFDYYDTKIQPKRGKTLIWPAEWTHAHSGAVLKKGKKYIITGWIDFKV